MKLSVGVVLTLVVSSTVARECQSTDYLPFTTSLGSCLSASKLPLANASLQDFVNSCQYQDCKDFYNSIATLDCTIGGSPVSLLKMLCADPSGNVTTTPTTSPTTNSTTAPTTKPTNTTTRTPMPTITAPTLRTPVPPSTPFPTATAAECTVDDTPLAFPDQLRQCLAATGLKVPPVTKDDWAKLCPVDACAKTVKLYSSLSCNIGGVPAADISKVCTSIQSDSSISTTTAKPASSTSSIAVVSTVALVLVSFVL
ncbi:hypothetical protein AeMF1_003150 [Aphanomyces euteiches]|nr:hypothetical protein AeMF1_003150 [Aphanomyces euteiches]KAH9192766.1 hypothetical protein AeNC1_005253 [Aphanomyces euteiches]